MAKPQARRTKSNTTKRRPAIGHTSSGAPIVAHVSEDAARISLADDGRATTPIDTRELKDLFKGKKFGRGRAAGSVPWQRLVREWQQDGLTFLRVWARGRHLVAEADRRGAPHPILAAVVENNADPRCQGDHPEAAHPRGWHWHVWSRQRRLVTVSAGRIRNFMSEK